MLQRSVHPAIGAAGQASIRLAIGMQHTRYIVFFIILGNCLLRPAFATADRIVLKDGTVEQSDRVWLSEKYIHFILKGTASVEIRFSKEIVERVESDSVTFPAKAPEATPVQSNSGPVSPIGIAGRPSIDEASAQNPAQDRGPDDQLVSANMGISFYDPHREKRYWAERNARFGSLEQALKAIAVRYQRPTDWVVDHMGEENDLGIIYASLNRRLASERAENQNYSPPGNPHFKDPEHRESPASSAHLQKEPPHEQSAPGNTPDFDGSVVKSATNISKGAARGSLNDQAMPLTSFKGIQFYDPRRPQKYWVGPDEKYDTLNAALKALAVQYHTTVQWVEDHIGNTNALSEIHENLRNGLQP